MKDIKIAIQPTELGFTDDWIEYCKKHSINYVLVDSTDSDIIQKLEDCDIYMWNHDLLLEKDNLLAKRLLTSLEHAGKKVFPDHCCGWHYDDKVAQKYLLESIKAPLIPTYIFYDKDKALNWVENTDFPKVFKLKGGASSINVKLVKNKNEAVKLIKQAFGKGFKPNNKMFYLKESFRHFNSKKITLLALIKSIYRYFFPVKYAAILSEREKSYVYFQDFVPNNKSDIRLVVINRNRVFGLERFNREDDFRASGSGSYNYLSEGDISNELLEMVFKVSNDLKMDSVAYDIVFDEDGVPKIIEISYSYVSKAYNKCPGYWNSDFTWVAGEVRDYQYWMIDKIIKDLS